MEAPLTGQVALQEAGEELVTPMMPLLLQLQALAEGGGLATMQAVVAVEVAAVGEASMEAQEALM